MLFILLFGIVSMFSDMTKESTESIRGAFFSLMATVSAACQLIAIPFYILSSSKRFS